MDELTGSAKDNLQSSLDKQVEVADREVVGESEYDREMEEKMKGFLGDKFTEGDEYHDDGDETELNVPDSLPANEVDHIVLGCTDIKRGKELFEEMTGLKTGVIITTKMSGTKTVRVGLDNAQYIEIVAPDPNSSKEGMSRTLATLPDDKLVPFHYAVRIDDKDSFVVKEESWERDEVTMVHADTKGFSETGEVAKWDMVVLYNHSLGGAVPYFVGWRGVCQLHPTARLAKTDANLDFVEVHVPSGNYASDLLSGVSGVAVNYGSPRLKFSIADTPKGRVTFETSDPHGIVMPGFGDDSHASMNRQ